MSSAAHIEIEHWDGPRANRERVDCPSVAALRERLSSLDGAKIDSVWVELDGVGALSIGGGPDKFIAVSFSADGSSSHVETTSQRSNSVELQVGGQVGIYPGVMILSAAMASAIAEHFLLKGEFDPSLRWVQDCPPE
jgi:hypothetical protein